MNKIIVMIIVVLIIILGLIIAVSYDNSNSDAESVVLTVSTEGPLELSEVIENIRNKDYYVGYDAETLDWMESLGSKSVFISPDAYVIMSNYDASKLKSKYITDAYINQKFSCKIIESNSLGSNFSNVLYVKDVKYISEELHSLQGGA